MYTWKHLFLWMFAITSQGISNYLYKANLIYFIVFVAISVLVFYELLNKWFMIKENK